jgi:hypothetical protein
VAEHLLEQTGYEWDGRGVTMVGLSLPLPAHTAGPDRPGQPVLPAQPDHARRGAPDRYADAAGPRSSP